MATIEKTIQEYKEINSTKLSSKIKETLQNATKRLEELDLKSKALRVGDKIPEFTLTNQNNKIVNIKDIIEKNRYTVINFFRGDWCPYCNIELNALQKIISQLKILNTTLISLSPQTSNRSLYSKQNLSLDFEIFYDKNNTIAKDFGLTFTLDKELIPIYENLGIDILESNKTNNYTLPIPATFIVNKNYEIIYSFVEEDYTKRCEPKDILNIIKKEIINTK